MVAMICKNIYSLWWRCNVSCVCMRVRVGRPHEGWPQGNARGTRHQANAWCRRQVECQTRRTTFAWHRFRCNLEAFGQQCTKGGIHVSSPALVPPGWYCT